MIVEPSPFHHNISPSFYSPSSDNSNKEIYNEPSPFSYYPSPSIEFNDRSIDTTNLGNNDGTVENYNITNNKTTYTDLHPSIELEENPSLYWLFILLIIPIFIGVIVYYRKKNIVRVMHCDSIKTRCKRAKSAPNLRTDYKYEVINPLHRRKSTSQINDLVL